MFHEYGIELVARVTYMSMRTFDRVCVPIRVGNQPQSLIQKPMSMKHHQCSTRDQNLPGSHPPYLQHINLYKGGREPGSKLASDSV